MTNRQSPTLFAPSAALQWRALALRVAIVIALGGIATASGGGAVALAVTLLVAALLAVQLFVLHPVRVLTDGSAVVYLRGYRRREQWPRRLTRFTALPDGGGFAAWTAADHVVVRCRYWSAAEIDALLRDMNADPLWTVPDADAVSSVRWRSARGGG
ncbi:hypothetical protein HQQ81_00445 [Microbacteriaceae bacterium VKM Ac-2854]|nr:hypothetical protein [Microbacteriaceae bacterium VKM Ac-2854]